MPTHPNANASRLIFFGLGLMAAALLLMEIGLTRILSVALWYHFAFMVISTALFGLGFAGLALSLRPSAERISARLLSRFALFAPFSFVFGFLLFNWIPFEPFSLGKSAVQWLYLPLAYLAVTLPFFGAGLCIAGVLTRYAKAIHRLYLVDLLGAALGSLLIVVLLPILGGSGTLLAAAAMAAAGAALISFPVSKLQSGSVALLALVLLLSSFWGDDLIPVRISANKVVGSGRTVADVLADPRFHLHTSWNTISRIDVIEHVDRRGKAHRTVLIDAGTAVTRLAHPEIDIDLLGPTSDEESFFVRQFEKPNVLVVGSGGGREVLLALRNGAGRVVGVEINPAINQLVKESMATFTGHLYQHPRVEMVTDEARSYIRRSQERFHVIHCPHTISNASLSSGSLSLAENHLLTLEAFQDYLEHLEAEGILVLTRPEAHLPRLFTTARRAFELAGLDGVDRSVLAWRAKARGLSFYAGFVLRKRPFRHEEVLSFQRVLKQRELEEVYLPGADGSSQEAQAGYYRRLLTHSDPESLVPPFAAITTPAVDNKPFFNQRVPFSSIGMDDLLGVFSSGAHGRMALEERPVAESALLVVLIQSTVMALVFILAPLWVFRRRALAGRGRLGTLSVFSWLGLSYIVVEIGCIQRFGLYLGRPVLVFATVLSCLLAASGMGSAFVRRYQQTQAPLIAAGLAGVFCFLFTLCAPWVTDATLAWSGPLRVGVSILLLTPLGFVMGMPFPLLIARLERSYPERIPWAWGVNGFASVLGSIGAVLIGMTLGFNAVLWMGGSGYFVAALCCLALPDKTSDVC
jgi:predicted membrane-bound spermidine synthase